MRSGRMMDDYSVRRDRAVVGEKRLQPSYHLDPQEQSSFASL